MAEEGKKAGEKSKYPLDYLIVASAAFLIVGLLAGMFVFPQSGAPSTATPSGFVTVSKEKAGEEFASFVNKNILSAQGATLTVKGTKDLAGYFYQLDVEIKSGSEAAQPMSLLVTKDGRYAIPVQAIGPIVLDLQAEVEVPQDDTQGDTGELVKSDKPVADVFVFSYCPYGLQVEKGLFPVVELLTDNADITVRQIGAMHGTHEELEAKRQLCLREEQPETLYKYMAAFAASADISACQDKFYSESEFNYDENKMEACVAPFISKMMGDSGVDSAKLETCMQGKAQEYYDSDMAYAAGYSVTGSPTLLVNGTNVQIPNAASRAPSNLLGIICGAFNDPPVACAEGVSSEAPSPGFGGGTGTGSGGSC